MSYKQTLFPAGYPIGTAEHQSGAVLVISLIILLLLTIIGLSATQVTGLEEKMAGNLRDRNLAFQAAETALREGEKDTSKLLCPITTQVGGFYPSSASPAIKDDSFWLNPSNVYSYQGVILGNVSITGQPRYIIQCLPNPPNVLGSGSFYFRIIARGTGGTTNAVVILQSIYRR